VTDLLHPAVPAGAYDEFLPGALPRAQQDWTPADGPLPALYLSQTSRCCSSASPATTPAA
jgi:4,5-DOPA dioxygenase extradiol